MSFLQGSLRYIKTDKHNSLITRFTLSLIEPGTLLGTWAAIFITAAMLRKVCGKAMLKCHKAFSQCLSDLFLNAAFAWLL